MLSLAPGLTRTAFFDGLNGGSRQGGYETPEQGVATAMRALGRGRRPSVQSGRLHALMVGLPRLFTRRRTVLLSGWITVRSSGAATVPAQGVVSEARDARRPACRLHR
ncbi:hypothetical protein [Streptomyces sp. NPDC017260]|uniref:hypothetical protein n=1 Tax=unclassified Streptomyces TaxID=2593676 RepID=UPI0037AE968F